MVNERRPQTWVTYALIAVNVLVFGYELANGADLMNGPTPQKMIDLGGDFAPLTLDGQWWRLATSMFLHYGIAHIGMNMLCLYQGRIVEIVYGRAGFAALYVASGLVGGIASLGHASNVVSAGASGAVFGVFGAFGAFLLLRRDRLDPVAVRNSARSLAFFIAINLVIGLQSATIDLSAHVGGLVAGALAGAALLVGTSANSRRGLRALAVAIAAVAVTAVALVALPKPKSIARQQQLDDLYHQLELDHDQKP